MPTYIALLRGVTPTGKNRVPMALLRQALHNHGFPGARTWIQSGNVLVNSPLSPEETGDAIRQIMKEHLGPELAVIVKTAEDVREVLAANPFSDLLPDRVFYTQWQEALNQEKAEALLSMDFGEERLAITHRAAYLYIPGSAARSKLNNNFLERRLGISATTRNRNTLIKLAEMAEEEISEQ